MRNAASADSPEGHGEIVLDDQVAGSHIEPLLHHAGGHQGVGGVELGPEVVQSGSQLAPLLVDPLPLHGVLGVHLGSGREGEVRRDVGHHRVTGGVLTENLTDGLSADMLTTLLGFQTIVSSISLPKLLIHKDYGQIFFSILEYFY